MIVENRLRIFNAFLTEFPKDRPVTKYLPEYFKRNKQMGSRDRKNLSKAIYSYFRLGNCLAGLKSDERLFVALFLTANSPDDMLAYFKPDYQERITNSLAEKAAYLTSLFPEFNLNDIFPFTAHLSSSIDQSLFISSQLIQPDLFIRAIKGAEQKLEAYLNEAQIPFEKKESCYRLPNAAKLLNTEYLYEVQDQSSQYTANYFQPKPKQMWWDCCAASGGKSLLLHALEPTVHILASDNRASSLLNLEVRFKQAGITQFRRREIDLLAEINSIEKDSMDGIILDAPCSGSGTWSRTPEMLSQFKESQLEKFIYLQRTIAENAVQFLKPGCPLVYITCSVFKEENEEAVAYFLANLPLKLEKMELIKGYESKADTMFVARFLKH
jgi:16S rRNA (cytosine967-C5)-methyltransferase